MNRLNFPIKRKPFAQGMFVTILYFDYGGGHKIHIKLQKIKCKHTQAHVKVIKSG